MAPQDWHNMVRQRVVRVSFSDQSSVSSGPALELPQVIWVSIAQFVSKFSWSSHTA